MTEILEGHREQVVQLPLREKLREGQRRFREGEIIYPASSRRGALRKDIIAHRIPGKIKGLSAWESEEEVPLYFDQGIRRLRTGTKFGAYSKKPKR